MVNMDISLDNGKIVITPHTPADERDLARWYEFLKSTPNSTLISEMAECRRALILQVD